MYDAKKIQLPPSWNFLSETSMAKELYRQRQENKRSTNDARMFSCTESECREYVALTYGMISFVDSCVGKILTQMEEKGFGENTVVIFLSDHGDMMGDHQLMLKGPLHYEGLVKTPLLWKDPCLNLRKKVQSLFSTMDLGVSILERACIKPLHGMVGISMLTSMKNDEVQHLERDCVIISEICQIPYLHKVSAVETVETIITACYKLMMFYEQNEFFLIDLSRDEMESNNVWDTAGSDIKCALLMKFIREKWNQGERCPRFISYA